MHSATPAAEREGGRSAEALEVRGLDAFYGKAQVLFDVDLDVGHGEVLTVLGRNGAGKTTLLHAIAGLASASADSLAVEGEPIGRRPAFQRVRRGLALVPSGARVFPNLSVRENLDTVRPAAGADAWTIERVYEIFPVLERLQASRGGQLSGGERQMLAVGRALMANPRVLMLDEPSEGLAPIILEQLVELLRKLGGLGLSVLLAEQDQSLALEAADRVCFIEKGQIVWEGTTERALEEDAAGRYLAL